MKYRRSTIHGTIMSAGSVARCACRVKRKDVASLRAFRAQYSFSLTNRGPRAPMNLGPRLRASTRGARVGRRISPARRGRETGIQGAAELPAVPPRRLARAVATPPPRHPTKPAQRTPGTGGHSIPAASRGRGAGSRAKSNPAKLTESALSEATGLPPARQSQNQAPMSAPQSLLYGVLALHVRKRRSDKSFEDDT